MPTDDKVVADLKERLTRIEERLVAEKSARATKETQIFTALDGVKRDAAKAGNSLADIALKVNAVAQTVGQISTTLAEQSDLIEKIEEDGHKNRDSINQIDGSVRAIKFIWPIVLGLLGLAYTLIVMNIDLKISAVAPATAVQNAPAK